MISLLISVLLAWTPFAQEGKDIPFDIRARQNLLMGKGGTSGSLYYDVVITRQPTQGILIKLPYTKKGGKFSFDLHHRIAMTEDFGLPAEVTTVIEVLSGGTTSLGISIVGQMLIITRGATTTRVDTPGTRIAAVSNFKFAETSPGVSLTR